MERRERGMRGRQSKGGGREGGERDKVREEGDGGNERRVSRRGKINEARDRISTLKCNCMIKRDI